MIDILTKSGKYRIIQNAEGEMTIFRHNEPWITQVKGMKMIIELACEIEELREIARGGGKQRLLDFANLVKDFFDNDPAGHARYLREQAINAIHNSRG